MISNLHLAETLENAVEQIDWLLGAPWDAVEAGRKLGALRAQVQAAADEALDLALVADESEED